MKKLIILLVLAGAGYVFYLSQKEKPGEGVKAVAGKAAAQQVIRGLESYKQAHSTYPADLEDLAGEGGGLPDKILGNPIRYERYDATYDLTFSYATPLPVHCTYSPESRWRCAYF